MNEKITLIIPVYNKKKYINHCLDSISAQTFEDFEVLLVDDGSTDGSAEICDEFANNNARVRVIHKQNGGVSSARNRGIEEAAGKYVIFCDADDEFPPDALSDLFAAAEKYGADITVGGAGDVIIDKRRNEIRTVNPLERDTILLEDRDARAFGEIWEKNNMLSCCLKLFSRDFLMQNNLRFDEKMVVLEDLDFVARSLIPAKIVVSIENVVYKFFHYLEQGENYLRRSRRDFADDVARAYNRQKQVFEEYGVDLYENRWARWRCLFGNFDGALNSLWNTETNSFGEKLDKCKRIRDVLKKPEFRVYVDFNRDNLNKREYFYMKHPTLAGMFLLRRLRGKLGK